MTSQQPDQQFESLPAVRNDLLHWFAANRRDLPWRHTRDPYRIMVSEIMLQQTQVDRVVPKYHAFLEHFPTLQALAEAPTSEVIRMWSGLGYNRRAVNMQRAARAVIEQHNGQFPQDVAALLALPGIGPYTAGAIACFAFEQDVAFVDTNIRRVLQRVFVGLVDDTPANDTALLVIGRAAVPAGQGWLWNQAIMELGALICTAAAPQCWRCPLQPYCRDYAARRNADETVFAQQPAPRRQRKVAERREAPFANSNRYFRGRVVEVLRGLPAGGRISLVELGHEIKADYTADDSAWLQTLIGGLQRDGLIAVEDEHARLP